MGTLQYAGVHLRTPLFVVLGHEGCGAVQAALAARAHGSSEPDRIAALLQNIEPSLQHLDASQPVSAQMHAAVEANVRWAMHQLHETPEVKARTDEGLFKLIGAIYELETGRGRFL